MIQLIASDLDGTLLPMDQDVFIKHYFATPNLKANSEFKLTVGKVTAP